MATIERGRQWRGKIVTADEIEGGAHIRATDGGRLWRVHRMSDGMCLLANIGSREAAVEYVQGLNRKGALP